MSSSLAGIATFAMNASIWVPLLWVNNLNVRPGTIGRLVLVIWAFHGLSAAVGVLQVVDPDRYMPNVSAVYATEDQKGTAIIRLDSGQNIFRPMGLSDTPGAAARSGMYAVLFGVGVFCGKNRHWLLRAAAVGGMTLGLFCLYVCQVRSLLVMTGIGAIAYSAILVARNEGDALERAYGRAAARGDGRPHLGVDV